MQSTFHRLVHLDLKGGVPKMSYICESLPLWKSWGATGLLVEYEDMFPYKEELEVLARSDAYSLNDLDALQKCAESNGLILIPLVQTFGHLEFLLKHDKFRHLREEPVHPGSICPSNPVSVSVVEKMIKQIVEVHPNLEWLHIGADEVYDLNCCSACLSRDISKEAIYLSHVSAIAHYVKDVHGLQPIMWDDMLRGCSWDIIKGSKLPQLVEPMVWHYVRAFELSELYFTELTIIFPRVWGASAFKGATGPCQMITSSAHHVENHQQWVKVIERHRHAFVGIALTGWSRFDHFSTMCELLPVAVPSLCLCLRVLVNEAFTVEVHEQCSKELEFPELIPWEPLFKDVNPSLVLKFPGWRVYQGVHGMKLLIHEFNLMIDGDNLCRWMSPWHRKKITGNPSMVAHIHADLKSLLDKFMTWRSIFEADLRKVFKKSTVEEWLEIMAISRMAKLERMIQQAKGLMALGDSYGTMETGT